MSKLDRTELVGLNVPHKALYPLKPDKRDGLIRIALSLRTDNTLWERLTVAFKSDSWTPLPWYRVAIVEKE